MRTTSIPMLVLAAVTSACDPAPTAPSSAVPAASRAARAGEPVHRPIVGRCEATFAAPTPVSPGVIRQVDAGTCTLSHLGESGLISDKVIDLVAGTQTISPIYIAANGDRLYASGGGTNTLVVPGLVHFAATMTVTGGTGRFAAASGELRVEGEADLVARTSAMALTGWIAY